MVAGRLQMDTEKNVLGISVMLSIPGLQEGHVPSDTPVAEL